MHSRRILILAASAALLVFVGPADAEGFVIDRHSVELFEQIPPEYVAAARDLRVMFSDRSVGQNINEGLNCLTAASWAQAPAYCRRDYTGVDWNWKTFNQSDLDAGLVPSAIQFDPDPVLYDRSNWTFEARSGSWSELTGDFINSLAPSYLATKDVLTYQFSYLNVTDGDDIANPATGFFADNPDRYDVFDLEAFIAQHPDKVFIFWTTSLARGIGTDVSTAFNDQMRAYCLANDRILFDMADIEAYTPEGDPCYDNRDGIPYVAQNGTSENHPDDGHDYPAICQRYTTETDGGHLGSVSAGHVRTVKAMWVLMARVAGWDPSVPADTDQDGDVDLGDYGRFQECFVDPSPMPLGDCADRDFDGDGDVDLGDYALLNTCLNGPNATPQCTR